MAVRPPEEDAAKAKTGPSHLQPLFAIGGAVGSLAAVLAALVFTGTLERLPRNHPWMATFGFALVVVAAGLWTFAFLDATPQEEAKGKHLKRWGIFFFVVGILLVVAAVFWTYSQDEQPAISGQFDTEKGLVVEVTVGRLASDDFVTVSVHGLRRDPEGFWEAFRLYSAAVGPDAAGDVDHEFTLPIAPGTYEILRVRATTSDDRTLCAPIERQDDDQTLVDPDSLSEVRGAPKTGCLMLTLPRFARVPRLDVALTSDGDQIDVGVQADNAPYRALLQLSTRDGGKRSLVARELLMPDAKGTLDFERVFDVPTGARRICTLASWYQSGEAIPPLACPRKTDNETVWSLVQVPRS